MTNFEIKNELEAADFSKELTLERNEIMVNAVNKIANSLERVFKKGTKAQERMDKILDTLVNSEKMNGTKEKLKNLGNEV